MEAKMKKLLKGILLLTIIGCFAGGGFADEIAGTTEITGYYQQYRDFSYKSGVSGWDFDPTRLAGGGFSIAQNIADWFAIWTQVSFYGTVDQASNYGNMNSVRIINNLQGIRYQTKQYGPLQVYGKAGAGVTNYSLYLGGYDFGGTKFSAGYGGGAHVWFHKNIGITLDVSHILNSLPNMENYFTDYNGNKMKFPDREKFDSGMVYTTGLTFRF